MLKKASLLFPLLIVSTMAAHAAQPSPEEVLEKLEYSCFLQLGASYADGESDRAALTELKTFKGKKMSLGLNDGVLDATVRGPDFGNRDGKFYLSVDLAMTIKTGSQAFPTIKVKDGWKDVRKVSKVSFRSEDSAYLNELAKKCTQGAYDGYESASRISLICGPKAELERLGYMNSFTDSCRQFRTTNAR